ncbi:unnamed protein product [Urochloa humidicola]
MHFFLPLCRQTQWPGQRGGGLAGEKCVCEPRGIRAASTAGDEPIQRERERPLDLGERDGGVVSRGDALPVSRLRWGGFCKIDIIQTGYTAGLYMP